MPPREKLLKMPLPQPRDDLSEFLGNEQLKPIVDYLQYLVRSIEENLMDLFIGVSFVSTTIRNNTLVKARVLEDSGSLGNDGKINVKELNSSDTVIGPVISAYLFADKQAVVDISVYFPTFDWEDPQTEGTVRDVWIAKDRENDWIVVHPYVFKLKDCEE